MRQPDLSGHGVQRIASVEEFSFSTGYDAPQMDAATGRGGWPQRRYGRCVSNPAPEPERAQP